MITAFNCLVALLSGEARAEPAPGMTRPVLEWARRFVLATPDTYTMTADRPQYSEGILVQLRVDPALLVPRQVGQPVLYVGELPLFSFNADYVSGCLVAYLPVPAPPLDLAAVPLYWSSTELPERLDQAKARQARAEAEREGARPLDPAQVAAAFAAGGPVLQARDLRDVHRNAMERVALCSATPSDLQRPGVP